MAQDLRVDTDVLARAGATLRAVGDDLTHVTAAAGLRAVVGHDGLGDVLDELAHGWDDARSTTVRVVGELGDAVRHLADTFTDVDDELAARLREAFA